MSLESILTFTDVSQKEVSKLHISEVQNFGEASKGVTKASECPVICQVLLVLLSNCLQHLSSLQPLHLAPPSLLLLSFSLAKENCIGTMLN